MTMRLLCVLLMCGTASATESVLGPTDSQPVPVVVEPGTPTPPDVIDCIVAALQAGLDPAEECEL
jgi:hypothetical protein